MNWENIRYGKSGKKKKKIEEENKEKQYEKVSKNIFLIF